MTIKQLLSNKRFKRWAALEYGIMDGDLSVNDPFDYLESLMKEWLDTPACLNFATDRDRRNKILTKGKTRKYV